MKQLDESEREKVPAAVPRGEQSNCPGAAPPVCDHPPIRLLIVESGRGAGGSTMSLYYLLKALDRTRFDPLVAFYFANDGPDTERLRLAAPIAFLSTRTARAESKLLRRLFPSLLIRGVRKLIVRPWNMLASGVAALWRLLRLMRTKSIQLVLLNNDVHYHVPAVLAAKLSGVPCVCRKAGGIGEGRHVKRWITPWVNLFISISLATHLDQIANNPGTRKVTTVFTGIDLDRFAARARPELRAELGLPPGKKVVASLARLTPGRGQQELLHAAPRIVQGHENVVFLFVGSESPSAVSYLSSLRAEADRMGIGDKVIFPGWRTDVPDILALVDVVVQCPNTIIEGLSVVVLEAMAAGKPVVVTDSGGLPDAVHSGRTGFVVPRGDASKLAEAVLSILQDEALAQRMGAAGRQRVEADFNNVRNVKKVEKLLEQCVTEASGGHR